MTLNIIWGMVSQEQHPNDHEREQYGQHQIVFDGSGYSREGD